MKTLHVKGVVFSGKREATKYLELLWVKKQIIQKFGFVPYSGTLNIKMINECCLRFREMSKKAEAIVISPEEGFWSGRCYRAYLRNNVNCVVVIPEASSYPENVIELVAPLNLREKLCLKDGDVVDLSIAL